MKAKPKPTDKGLCEPVPQGITVTKFEKVRITITINGQKIELTKEEAVKLRDELCKIVGMPIQSPSTDIEYLKRKFEEYKKPPNPAPWTWPAYPHAPQIPCKQPSTGDPIIPPYIVTCSL